GDGCGCLGAPVWSPDGSKIAYLHGEFFGPIDYPPAADATLAVMNADGSGRRDLTAAGQLNHDSLTWSPDAKQLAYVDAAGRIEVVNVDGSGSLELGSGYDPAWSPDGSKIAFAGADSSNNPAIFVMHPDGSGVQELASFPRTDRLETDGTTWSPDGT